MCVCGIDYASRKSHVRDDDNLLLVDAPENRLDNDLDDDDGAS